MIETLTTELLTNLRIGHNAKGTFEIPSNRVAVRAVGRALARVPMVSNIAVKSYQARDERTGEITNVNFFEATIGKQIRRTYWYTVKAVANQPFMRIYNRDFETNELVVAWSKYHIISPEWADGEEHTVWETVVQDIKGPHLSRANYAEQYHRFGNKQKHFGIMPGDAHWVNPLGMMTANALTIALARDAILGIKTSGDLPRNEIIQIIETFYQDELNQIAINTIGG